MKPICFPSTYVSDSVAEAMRACFGHFIVYQPLAGELPKHMHRWAEKGVLEIRGPAAEGQKSLKAVVKNYLSWADLHLKGSDLTSPFLQNWKDAIPFFEATSTSQVVSDIKEQVSGKTDSNDPEPLMAARLFLYFAQELDRQNQEISRDLKRSRQQEAELFQRLKMDDEILTTEFKKINAQIYDNSTDYMVLDRLQAWSRFFLADAELSGIFITHIPAIFQELLDRTPTVEKFLHFEAIPSCTELTAERAKWQQELMFDLAHVVEHQWLPTGGRRPDIPSFPAAREAVSLKVSIVPDQTPRDFFSCCAQIQPIESEVSRMDNRLKNTLIGLIEC
jgi:hypothetical protein